MSPDHGTFTRHDPILIRGFGKQMRLSHLQYFTFTIVGIALLWPWNCFLSASAYYAERFKHTPELSRLLNSTIMTVSSIVSTVFNAYLSQAQANANYNHRVRLGMVLTVGVFLIMAISCVSDLFIDMNDDLFFVVLISLVFLSALATCLAQNGTMAIVNVLGSIFANAVMVGQAIAGILPAIALMVSILLVGEKTLEKPDKIAKDYGVFFYYITASIVSIASLLLLAWVEKHSVARVYSPLGDEPNESEEDTPLTGEAVQTKHVPFKVLWSKLSLIVLAIFLTFSITLVFPVFASTIRSVHTSSTHIFFQDKIFVPFIFLMWNLGDLVSRIVCGLQNSWILIKSPKMLIVYSMARLLFIPLFFTCNIHPYTATDRLSALINSDLWYILLQFLFGFSNGQLATSSFMIVGSHCDDEDEKEAAGGFTTVFLSGGLAFGSVMSYLLVFFVK